MYDIILYIFVVSTIMFVITMIGVFMNIKNIIKLYWFRFLESILFNIKSEEIKFGEIIISDKGKLEIELLNIPKSVSVEFINNPTCVPCDVNCDELKWDIKKHNGKYNFIIKWNVSGIREIKWSIFY